MTGKRGGNEKGRVVQEEGQEKGGEEEEEAKDDKEEEENDEDGSWSIYRARPLLIIHARDSRGVART